MLASGWVVVLKFVKITMNNVYPVVSDLLPGEDTRLWEDPPPDGSFFLKENDDYFYIVGFTKYVLTLKPKDADLVGDWIRTDCIQAFDYDSDPIEFTDIHDEEELEPGTTVVCFIIHYNILWDTVFDCIEIDDSPYNHKDLYEAEWALAGLTKVQRFLISRTHVDPSAKEQKFYKPTGYSFVSVTTEDPKGKGWFLPFSIISGVPVDPEQMKSWERPFDTYYLWRLIPYVEYLRFLSYDQGASYITLEGLYSTWDGKMEVLYVDPTSDPKPKTFISYVATFKMWLRTKYDQSSIGTWKRIFAMPAIVLDTLLEVPLFLKFRRDVYTYPYHFAKAKFENFKSSGFKISKPNLIVDLSKRLSENVDRLHLMASAWTVGLSNHVNRVVRVV